MEMKMTNKVAMGMIDDDGGVGGHCCGGYHGYGNEYDYDDDGDG